MGRKKLHDDETGEKLLDAAESLLEQGGLGAVSARAVAASCGTTTRAVYSVFGDMDGLTSGLTARGYYVLVGYLDMIEKSKDPVEDLVTVAIKGFRAFALARPHLFRLTFVQVPPTALEHPAVEKAIAAGVEALGGFIVHAQQNGIGETMPRQEFAAAYHALCQGLAEVELSYLPPPVGAGFKQLLGDQDPVSVWTTAITALLRGLQD